MSQIELSFPDGSVRSVASGTTGLEILAKVKDGDTDLGVQPF